MLDAGVRGRLGQAAPAQHDWLRLPSQPWQWTAAGWGCCQRARVQGPWATPQAWAGQHHCCWACWQGCCHCWRRCCCWQSALLPAPDSTGLTVFSPACSTQSAPELLVSLLWQMRRESCTPQGAPIAILHDQLDYEALCCRDQSRRTCRGPDGSLGAPSGASGEYSAALSATLATPALAADSCCPGAPDAAAAPGSLADTPGLGCPAEPAPAARNMVQTQSSCGVSCSAGGLALPCG